ncbi:LPS export ABC transporter periplasmic protein LptC [Candidatus Steffania adelgidicola]|uniref:LPS export ABC transporter periplasmic protein LptC n=1 Tax=Candidatus Steffania adelgidicola TaxID=1076626 RepID=UPI001D026D5E|nr:LPS export ABC transporter periplasmic protein LptC [Candidatus Steffania adelgidicola]UDG80193.1 Lipopolysaccharide export system protein LptC [Candidatus Steffania adelgidicola]
MSRMIYWITALLGLVALVLTAWYVTDTDTAKISKSPNTSEPTYQTEYTTTVVYNSEGGIHYQLVAAHVNYFAEPQITWFTKPCATTFDENKVPAWTVKADKGKLIQNRLLYLHGHIQVESLTDISQLKRITTKNAVINLITQEIFSDDEVTLSGTGFNSTGMKMRCNLRNKTAELMERVKTYYAFAEL